MGTAALGCPTSAARQKVVNATLMLSSAVPLFFQVTEQILKPSAYFGGCPSQQPVQLNFHLTPSLPHVIGKPKHEKKKLEPEG